MHPRTRRLLTWSVAVAVVLCGGAYMAEPYARDWAVARNVCDGAVSQGTVDQLAPEDTHLKESRGRLVEQLGTYTCTLTAKRGDHARDWSLLSMSAYTRRDDQDLAFYDSFPEYGSEVHTVLPGGLPGFVDRFRDVVLRVPCPDLGKDGEGRARQLVSRVSFDADALVGGEGAAYRAAVSFTNSASKRLGCGADPLTLTGTAAAAGLADPGRGEDPRGVVLADAEKTPCAWAAGAGLPAGVDWRVSGEGSAAAPLASCQLDVPEEAGVTEAGGESIGLYARYGDWSTRFVTRDSTHGGRSSMTATVQCDGEAANFSLDSSDGVRDLGLSEGVSEADERRLLRLFVADQMERHGGCVGEPKFHF
ncbi:hypothetical protein [Streptomyces avermitilis]|uniref:hypothetical protein n=1 Tax=Streptomyces avermitilis TaxID=33903 RepID=UPI0033B1EBEB